MIPKKSEQDRQKGRTQPTAHSWNGRQDDWFSAPGDVDDFIFYDTLGENYGDEEWPHTSLK